MENIHSNSSEFERKGKKNLNKNFQGKDTHKNNITKWMIKDTEIGETLIYTEEVICMVWMQLIQSLTDIQM